MRAQRDEDSGKGVWRRKGEGRFWSGGGVEKQCCGQTDSLFLSILTPRLPEQLPCNTTTKPLYYLWVICNQCGHNNMYVDNGNNMWERKLITKRRQ